MRQVKEIIELNDVFCENCLFYNEGDCLSELPVTFVEPEDRCSTHGKWCYKKSLFSFEEICTRLEYHKLVESIEDLKCQFCIHYFPVREECHYRKTAHYRSQPDSWCNHGQWLYCVEMMITEGKKEINKVVCQPIDVLYLLFNLHKLITGGPDAD